MREETRNIILGAIKRFNTELVRGHINLKFADKYIDQILTITGEYEEVELPKRIPQMEHYPVTLADKYYNQAQQDILKLCGGKIYKRVK